MGIGYRQLTGGVGRPRLQSWQQVCLSRYSGRILKTRKRRSVVPKKMTMEEALALANEVAGAGCN